MRLLLSVVVPYGRRVRFRNIVETRLRSWSAPPVWEVDGFCSSVVALHGEAGDFFDIGEADVCVGAVEDAGDFFEGGALGFDVEEVDEELGVVSAS